MASKVSRFVGRRRNKLAKEPSTAKISHLSFEQSNKIFVTPSNFCFFYYILSLKVFSEYQMIGFSIVLVSRARPDMLKSLVESLRISSVIDYEVIVGIDDDDPYLDQYLSLFSLYDIKYECKKRIDNLHVRINSLIDLVDGKYIFVLNDDCLLKNFKWDADAVEVLDAFGDIVYGRTYDNSIDRVSQEYAAFPIISKNAALKLGFIMDETFGNHGADVITYRIYENAKKVVDLPMVLIDHVFHNSHQALIDRQLDKTAMDMIKRTVDNGFNVNNLFEIDITEKSKRVINE